MMYTIKTANGQVRCSAWNAWQFLITVSTEERIRTIKTFQKTIAMDAGLARCASHNGAALIKTVVFED
jgi:hypothetical protein